MLSKYILILSVLVIPFQSCTTSRKMSDNQTISGHFKLYSYPQKLTTEKFDTNRYKKLTFVSSNDFEGNINPTNYPIKNRFNENRTLKIGGISAMKSYLDIFRKVHKDNLLYLDAGSFLHETNNHLYTLFLYDYLNVDVASLGLNEFLINDKSNRNFKSYIQSLTRKANFNIVSSNIFDLSETEQIKWKGISEYSIKKVNGVKVGFIGVLTPGLSSVIPDKQINGLYIQNPSKNIILKARTLRRKGAQVIVLLANKGLDCTSQLSHEENIIEDKVNFYPKDSKHCATQENELYQAIQKLPPNTIDLIFTSGEKSKVANFIMGHPVFQNSGQGKFLSWVDVYFDMKHNSIDSTMTKAHQPIQLCHSFLKNTLDCFTKEGIENEELVPAMLFGQKVEIQDIPKLK